MKKNKELLWNTITPLILEVVTIFSSFVIPRLIILKYGSEVNGLVQSIAHFLSIIAFLEMGVGSVVRYNLYKPLENHDKEQLSKVVVSGIHFFRKIAGILLIYTIGLMIIYPILHYNKFGAIYTALLIGSMCISSFAQYYFGQMNQILLIADQKGYIQYCSQIITILLNTIVTVYIVKLNYSIQFVKLSTSIIFLLRPLFLSYYVRKNYGINYKIEIKSEPIKQKWNGVAQHISSVVLENTDVIILTVFSTLSDVSVYSAYVLIVGGIKKLITTATSGIQSKIGHVIAQENEFKLNKIFSYTEWVIHTASTFLFGCSCALIVPFIMVYTRGITDANYYVPLFGIFITLANFGHSLRLPYSIIILSAGHYKQTQKNYIIAASMNVVISAVVVKQFGLIGVAVGTLIAMIYQTIWMANYCYFNILHMAINRFWKQLFVDVASISISIIASFNISINEFTYFNWIKIAIPFSIIYALLLFIINSFAYRHIINNVINIIIEARKIKKIK